MLRAVTGHERGTYERSTEVGCRQMPGEGELKRERDELCALEITLVQREFDPGTLQAVLRAFEACCLSSVGLRYAERDQCEAQNAAAVAWQHPGDTGAGDRPESSHREAEQSRGRDPQPSSYASIASPPGQRRGCASAAAR